MIDKSKYQVYNWHDYNESLVNRGTINLWIDQYTLDHWLHSEDSDNGRFVVKYFDACIECGIRIKAMYKLPWRAVEVSRFVAKVNGKSECMWNANKQNGLIHHATRPFIIKK